MAFYIRKTANGRLVWLKRQVPAIVWGPKAQAITFATQGAARLVLANLPKADKAEIVDGATNGGN